MVLRFDDAQRRARLVARHHLGRSATDPVEVARAVVAIHSSDPLTPHLAAWARIPGFATSDLDEALYEERSLVRVHAMRRTLFVVPTEDRHLFEAAVGRDIAAKERRRLIGWLEAEMDPDAAAGWLQAVEEAVLDALADGEVGTRELTERVPALATKISVGSGRWITQTPVSSRVLFLLGLDGRVVRTRPGGSWRSSQYRWARSEWLGPTTAPMDPATARHALARAYIATHGPVTMTDLRWWTGWTAAQAKAALAGLETRTVQLQDGEGLVLADDEPTPPLDGPVVTLLPSLDPSAMGWKDRDWYVGPHAAALFDRNGNAGPTVWVDGRMVGAWAQRPDGEVVHRLLEDVAAAAADLVEERARELSAWMGGATVTPRFRTPLERELSEQP